MFILAYLLTNSSILNLQVERVSNGLKLEIDAKTDAERKMISKYLHDYLSFIKANIEDIEPKFEKEVSTLQQELETLKLQQEVQMLQMKVKNAEMQRKIDTNHYNQQLSLLQEQLEESQQQNRIHLTVVSEKDKRLQQVNDRLVKLYEENKELIEEKYTDSKTALKSQIEAIEKGVRQLIATVLDENATSDAYSEFIPNHVQVSIQNEMRKKMNDEPSLTPADFPTLYDKLRLLVISKYYPIIKDNWTLFAIYFNEQSRVNKKFDQFGKLRNMIYHDNRHSDIILHEGKAAILYFKGVCDHHGFNTL